MVGDAAVLRRPRPDGRARCILLNPPIGCLPVLWAGGNLAVGCTILPGSEQSLPLPMLQAKLASRWGEYVYRFALPSFCLAPFHLLGCSDAVLPEAVEVTASVAFPFLCLLDG